MPRRRKGGGRRRSQPFLRKRYDWVTNPQNWPSQGIEGNSSWFTYAPNDGAGFGDIAGWNMLYPPIIGADTGLLVTDGPSEHNQLLWQPNRPRKVIRVAGRILIRQAMSADGSALRYLMTKFRVIKGEYDSTEGTANITAGYDLFQPWAADEHYFWERLHVSQGGTYFSNAPVLGQVSVMPVNFRVNRVFEPDETLIMVIQGSVDSPGGVGTLSTTATIAIRPELRVLCEV